MARRSRPWPGRRRAITRPSWVSGRERLGSSYEARRDLDPRRGPRVTDCEHRSLEVNGIRMHIAEQGRGPLVLLCHGFPETWYSWRHQLSALAAAGYRVVAPDMRGFGQTDRPADPTQYTQLHMAGDMVGLLEDRKSVGKGQTETPGGG